MSVPEPVRVAGRELAHELRNHLGVAIGSLELLRTRLGGGTPATDIDRALAALEDIDRLVGVAQSLLRGAASSAVAFDLGHEVASLVDGFRQGLPEPDRQAAPERAAGPMPVRYPRSDLQALVLSLLAEDGRTRVRLAVDESGTDPELGPVPLAGVLLRDVRPPRRGDGPSLVGERLRLRCFGGDLRGSGGEVLLLLPLARG
ncbi:MAG: hypothetical protein R3F30_05210 [Planctomycetota bacterium]